MAAETETLNVYASITRDKETLDFVVKCMPIRYKGDNYIVSTYEELYRAQTYEYEHGGKRYKMELVKKIPQMNLIVYKTKSDENVELFQAVYSEMPTAVVSKDDTVHIPSCDLKDAMVTDIIMTDGYRFFDPKLPYISVFDPDKKIRTDKDYENQPVYRYVKKDKDSEPKRQFVGIVSHYDLMLSSARVLPSFIIRHALMMINKGHVDELGKMFYLPSVQYKVTDAIFDAKDFPKGVYGTLKKEEREMFVIETEHDVEIPYRCIDGELFVMKRGWVICEVDGKRFDSEGRITVDTVETEKAGKKKKKATVVDLESTDEDGKILEKSMGGLKLEFDTYTLFKPDGVCKISGKTYDRRADYNKMPPFEKIVHFENQDDYCSIIREPMKGYIDWTFLKVLSKKKEYRDVVEEMLNNAFDSLKRKFRYETPESLSASLAAKSTSLAAMSASLAAMSGTGLAIGSSASSSTAKSGKATKSKTSTDSPPGFRREVGGKLVIYR